LHLVDSPDGILRGNLKEALLAARSHLHRVGRHPTVTAIGE
jgi:hypothetical protein